MRKKIEYKTQIALFLASLSVLIFGGFSLFQNGGINYTSLIASSSKVIPAVIIMYCLGWLVGSMIETSKPVKKANSMGYVNNLLDEIMKEEGLNNFSSSKDTELTDEVQDEINKINTEAQKKETEESKE